MGCLLERHVFSDRASQSPPQDWSSRVDLNSGPHGHDARATAEVGLFDANGVEPASRRVAATLGPPAIVQIEPHRGSVPNAARDIMMPRAHRFYSRSYTSTRP